MMPTLVAKPPQGDGWTHEVKFDGYRSQIIIDAGGARIFTRRRLDWTSKYRDLVEAAKALNVQNATIDGEVVVLNEAGLSDFAALRKAITRRQRSICCISTATKCATWRLRIGGKSWPALLGLIAASSSARRCQARLMRFII
ncbi:hypothetical protein BQ8794_210129 [Mesorhizobium prunaredense]|uniref:ATP-dependent DNA ligase family profile domain-containing protein n=1 Tax=Mesorhizobium prunaredense TaxID=1631249 RepID=A0A1R3VAR4_9HYPH|nr:hypothetical protein BQ8794_210129 [Mesorhizobium prunaredense]